MTVVLLFVENANYDIQDVVCMHLMFCAILLTVTSLRWKYRVGYDVERWDPYCCLFCCSVCVMLMTWGTVCVTDSSCLYYAWYCTNVPYHLLFMIWWWLGYRFSDTLTMINYWDCCSFRAVHSTMYVEDLICGTEVSGLMITIPRYIGLLFGALKRGLPLEYDEDEYAWRLMPMGKIVKACAVYYIPFWWPTWAMICHSPSVILWLLQKKGHWRYILMKRRLKWRRRGYCKWEAVGDTVEGERFLNSDEVQERMLFCILWCCSMMVTCRYSLVIPLPWWKYDLWSDTICIH